MRNRVKAAYRSILVIIIATLSINSYIADARSLADSRTFLPLIHNGPYHQTYYLSPTGKDSNPGTSNAPWATFDHAWPYLYPGDELILMDGVYHQTLSPNVRNGEPGKLIKIRAQHDGRAIIEGDGVRIPVLLGYWANPPVGDYFDIEGIVAQNSSNEVYMIWGSHNILRRVSGYNANKDENVHVFTVASADYNLIEDCVASGTGRKMVLFWGGTHNVARRCFTNWVHYEGRYFDSEWPWGEDLEIYNGSNSILENGISYGSPPKTAVSVYGNINSANGSTPYARDNQVMGVIAVRSGVYKDGSFWQWPTTRPQPTSTDVIAKYHEWPNWRIGFGVIMWGPEAEVTNTKFQDIFSWSNAGLGFAEYSSHGQKSVNTTINRATIINNGLDAVPSEGGPGTNVKYDQFSQATITNSRIAGTPYNNGEGARFVYRYVNGVLQDGTNGTTPTQLWPWPMENRILMELGIDVTGEITEILRANGVPTGKTLPPPQISPTPRGVSSEIDSVPYAANFTQPVAVTLSTNTAGGVIRYTTDGNEPTLNSQLYTGPFTLSTTTILKAKVFANSQESYASAAYYRINTGIPNAAPTVTADVLPFRYNYIDLMLPHNTADLYGLATDNTLLNSAALSTTWSQVNGPGSVTFANTHMPRTRVTLPSTPGIYTLRFTASDGQLSASKDVTIHLWPADNQGTVFTLPARIDAVNFRAGGQDVGYNELAASYGGDYRPGNVSQTIAYNDWSGYSITNLVPGEWYAYNVNVPQAGTYNVTVRLAGAVAGGKFHIGVDGTGSNLASYTIPYTNDGLRIYTSITGAVNLPSGSHTLYIVADQAAPGSSQLETAIHYMEITHP